MITLNLFFKPILSLFYALILGIFIKEVNSFTPISRNAFSSVLAGDKLYFFGGNPNSISNQTFCLDVSQSFSSENPPWIETPSAVIPFASVFATVSFIESSSIIYLFGGFMYDPVTLVDSFQSFVHTFNTQTLKWDIPKTNGQIPTRRRNIEAVKDNFGKIYIFGAPIARNEYTATLLSNESKSNSTQPQTHSNSPNSPSKDLTSKKVAISVVSSIVATAFLIGIGALLYRWSKKRKDKTTLRISGNFGIENNE
ncbi:18859_t:CDS:2 [Funneliformis geosporum]|uniref:18859_t:CDS:1 n=1 Tax=Funneliformis geosporum TaxID=1117311 RepID=A0A9W4SCR7_9GLOM|nr:18859_t:CDS:2 [Funneliformis geosporum]